MNDENLRPIQKGQLSKEELKKRQSNGGKKSGQVRRQRKAFKENLEILLQMKVPEVLATRVKQTLPKIKDKDLDFQNAILASLMQAAIRGNVKAVELIRDTIGEKPVDKIELTSNEQIRNGLNKLDNLL